MKKFLLKLFVQHIVPMLLKTLLPAIMEQLEKQLEDLLKKFLTGVSEQNAKTLASYKSQMMEDLKNGLQEKS